VHGARNRRSAASLSHSAELRSELPNAASYRM
jgi:hypothetical protein